MSIKAQNKYFDTVHDWTFQHYSKSIIIKNDIPYLLGILDDQPYFDTIPSFGYIMDLTKDNSLTYYSQIYAEVDRRIKFWDFCSNEDFFYVAGFQSSKTALGYGFLNKLNSSNEPVVNTPLDTTIHHPVVYDIIKTADDSFLLSGLAVIDGDWYPHLSIFDIDGNYLWDTVYTEIQTHAWIQDVALAEDGGFYLLISYNQGQSQGDVYLMKTNDKGEKEWINTYNYGAGDYARDILACKEGGVIFTLGSTSGYQRIVKLDKNYQEVFTIKKYFKGEAIGGIKQLPDSSYILLGNIETVDTINWTYPEDLSMLKLDVNGNFLWQRIYSMQGRDSATDLDFDSKGNIYLLGNNKRFSDYYNKYISRIHLIKTNCMGLLTEPASSFTYEEAAGEVTFTNTSLYVYPDSIDGGYYEWDFGDGSPLSNEVNPVHTYSEAGEYTVRLTGIVCSDTSVYEQTVLVTTTSVISPASPSLSDAMRIYPNPVDGDVLYIEVGGNYAGHQQGRILFYNTLGQLVLQSSFKNKVSVDNLPGGVYFVVVEVDGERLVEKVVIN